MHSRDFCYWLQGHFEMNSDDRLSTDQIRIIKNHLNLVFTNITSDIPDEFEKDKEKHITNLKQNITDTHNLQGVFTYVSSDNDTELLC